MIITTRPNQTFSGGGVTVSDGGGAAAALADDTRSTWVTFHHDNHPFFGFAEPVIPSGARVKEAVLKVEAKRSASGDPLLFNWHMYDPANGSNIFGSLDNVWVPPNQVSVSRVLIDENRGEPHVAPTNILVDAYSHGSGSSPSVLVFALYFETIVVERPVVTVSFPSGTVSGDTTPVVDWVKSLDLDGGPMTHFEVKLFTAAQYGAGGFDPDTSTPSQESGVLTPAEGDAWSPEDPLLDGGWRAYVRVAQTVNTELHWSAWAFSSFTVAINRPGVPTMTLTSEPTFGRIKVLLTTNAGAATTSRYQTQFSDDGVTWHDLWTEPLGNGQSTPSGNAATEYDYEAPNGGTRSYRARALHAYTEGYAASAWTAIQTSSWTSEEWWVKNLADPSLNLAFTREQMKSQPGSTRTANVGLFKPLGAKHPIAVMDKRSSASGEIVFLPDSDDVRDDFEQLLDEAAVVLIQAPPGVNDWPDRYCALLDYDRQRAHDSPWTDYSYDSVQWTEVIRPVP